MSPSQPQGLFHNNQNTIPLAERVRPTSLEEMIPPPGLSDHLLKQWQSSTGKPPSLILWGPPGSGKTTLARVLGNTYNATFVELSAVTVGVKDIRELVKTAKHSIQPTLLFLDEVHRFNKAQQDVLLPSIENGTISFIGATTENPTFALNSALLSRCEVVHLIGFNNESLQSVLNRALQKQEITLTKEESQLLIKSAQGDARALLRVLEGWKESEISLEEYLVKSPHILYDRDGDQHFDNISAFIKSMRRGDTDSALYFGFRMIEAGEDPRYLLRRMIIFASEDIGNAQPQALILANQAAEAYERVGLPEGKIPIAQAICFLATAPKSRASYNALRKVEGFLKENPNVPVPLHLRNKEPIGMSPEEQKHLEEKSPITEDPFYQPQDSGYESKLLKKD